MKNNPIAKTTIYVAAFSLALSVIMEAVFLIIGKWTTGVLYANAMSYGVSVLNFFLMAVTVTKAAESGENASLKLKLSQAGRLAMLATVLIIGFCFDCFNKVALVIPIFFPRISIMFSSMLGLFKDEPSPSSEEPGEANDDQQQ
ncbi:MAG: hypothetical protein J5850_00310 [Clostridia bacterium]|nr:hypothetical protein [Clostridia bacterium]